MQTLSKDLILSPDFQRSTDLEVPGPALLDLPEKVLQFGSGGFLRGFADFFVDRANRNGLFMGRVVVVGSTGSGRTLALNRQDGLYTLVSRGLQDGRVVNEARVIGSVSRALAARDQWSAVVACAPNPDLVAIISNTTEVGIVLDEGDRPDLAPPRSFPGKLTAFLHARARVFNFDPTAAPVILPCELLENNGDRLREIVGILASRWYDDADFNEWLGACLFCNTLVDRIVTGMPEPEKRDALFERLGYRDDLLIAAEPYRLWAVEGDAELLERVPFLRADTGIIVTRDIRPFRELKLRILNGSHTIMVPAAMQVGLETVREAVTDPVLSHFVRRVMFDEIVPSLDVDRARAAAFAASVLDRFANPFIVHRLHSIMLQATMKTRVRVVPSIRRYIEKNTDVPIALTLGFALYFLLLRRHDGSEFPPDDQADAIRAAWRASPGEDLETIAVLVRTLLSDRALWHTDLTTLPGFEAAVRDALSACLHEGVRNVLEHLGGGRARND